jgi:hypothetical protein
VGQQEPKELQTFFSDDQSQRELLPVKELTEFNKEFIDLQKQFEKNFSRLD